MLIVFFCQEFCQQKGFSDGPSVTEQKLIYFLDDCVLHRTIHSSRYKKDRTRLDGTDIQQTLGTETIKQYITAIVDLWSFQKSIGTNNHPNPRGCALKAVLDGRRRQESKRKREQYLDRAANTLQDGYDKDKLKAFVRFCWEGWRQTDGKNRKPQAQESYLRTAVDFLFSHNMLLRGEARRQLELPDIFTIPLSNEGPTPCWPMILMMNNGKTNQFGRLEYIGVIRHKEPLLCTMSQTAFYLFYRWEINQETPPRFWNRQLWYDAHLFKGQNVEKPLSYEIQLKWTNEVFDKINLSSRKKTHVGRSQGAKQAELDGVEENQIRRAGQWNQDALTNCYLTHLPRKFLRTMAGFAPEAIGNYWLPRAKIQPPASLVRAVWPWVDEWLSWFNSDDKSQISSMEDLGPMPEQLDQDDMAAQGFLRLLDQFRTIILQDSVVLQAEFPQHPMWNHPVFVREDYRLFASQLQQSLVHGQTPQEVQLHQTVPLIADRLINIHKDLQQTINIWSQKNQEQLKNIELQFQDLFSGRVTLNLQAKRPLLNESSLDPPLGPCTTSPNRQDSLERSEQPIPSSSTSAPLPPSLPSALLSSSLPSSPSSYRLSRTIQTVPELWREWTCGLGGNPSVQILEELHGPRWRPEPKERIFFSRRKVIIDEIRRRHESGHISFDAAVEEVELVRTRGKLSLHKLSELLSHARPIQGRRQL